MISLIIPCFNKSKFIGSTLGAVLSQTYADWEAIVVDDGSTDGSVKAIESSIACDSRMKLIKNKDNRGGSACRNQGLALAEGEYIIFLDADDLLARTCLEVRLKYFQQNPDYDFIVFPMSTFLEKVTEPVSRWFPKGGNNHLLQFLRHDLPWQTMQPIWKKSFIKTSGGFDESYPRLQDVEFHTRALLLPEVRYRIAEADKADCFYRICDERTEIDETKAVERRVIGTCKYLKNITGLIRDGGLEQSKRLSALKGTYITTVNHVLYMSKTSCITSTAKDTFLERICSVSSSVTLLGFGDRLLMRVYIFGYGCNLFKLKGYNRIFKDLISRC